MINRKSISHITRTNTRMNILLGTFCESLWLLKTAYTNTYGVTTQNMYLWTYTSRADKGLPAELCSLCDFWQSVSSWGSQKEPTEDQNGQNVQSVALLCMNIPGYSFSWRDPFCGILVSIFNKLYDGKHGWITCSLLTLFDFRTNYKT